LGWRKVVKAFKGVTSRLKIDCKAGSKLDKKVYADLEYLPIATIINKNALSICKTYRDYLGRIVAER